MSFGGGIGSRITIRQGSECIDRPDSGFDSKDEEELRSSTAGSDRSVLIGSFSSSSHNTTQDGQEIPPLIRPSSRETPYQESQQANVTTPSLRHIGALITLLEKRLSQERIEILIKSIID